MFNPITQHSHAKYVICTRVTLKLQYTPLGAQPHLDFLISTTRGRLEFRIREEVDRGFVIKLLPPRPRTNVPWNFEEKHPVSDTKADIYIYIYVCARAGK